MNTSRLLIHSNCVRYILLVVVDIFVVEPCVLSAVAVRRTLPTAAESQERDVHQTATVHSQQLHQDAWRCVTFAFCIYPIYWLAVMGLLNCCRVFELLGHFVIQTCVEQLRSCHTVDVNRIIALTRCFVTVFYSICVCKLLHLSLPSLHHCRCWCLTRVV